ncbi:uncharacterized protein EV420DRAFT_1484641 [Desarmillaria tabescens]|uniref:Uncharacterized protein n=1 Tax=Armillaria tabescens TaxID=1929756 RepID=A0AA39JL82_ARMTA|nr:uncharacterized protein EV420DRAFT_1484641 [Desarmillaria tabescens]KAK0444524.1 hypothetical protein EV420DRAFT_1484641 [Desarmillaria tabescens]
MVPFKYPTCKTTLGNNDSRSIIQYDHQCKSKKKSNSILLQGIKGLCHKLEETRKKREKRTERQKEVQDVTLHMPWLYDSNKKTLKDLDHLVYDAILQPDFSVSHCKGFSTAKEAHQLNKPDVFQSDVWKEDSIEILLPQKDYAWSSEAEAHIAKIDGVWHCLLTEILMSAFQDPSASNFYLKGYKDF